MTAQGRPNDASTLGLEAQIRISNPSGLHARPAVKLAQLAARFRADVWLRVSEQDAWVRAKSTAKVMKLKARQNSLLYLRAEGEQAESALSALSALIKRNFDEQAAAPAPATLNHSTQAAPDQYERQCERSIPAQIAAPGVAIGPLCILPDSAPTKEVRDSDQPPPEQQRQRLLQALERADQQLAQLALASAHPMGAEIIAFQRRLIVDEEFMAPIWQKLADGQPVQRVWSERFAQETTSYHGDEVLQSRVADLNDLCDRVLHLLGGLTGKTLVILDNAIVLSKELTPSHFLELDWSRLGGLVLQNGSYNSHVAMLARAHSVPMLIQLQTDIATDSTATTAILDASSGHLLIAPDSDLKAHYQQQLAAQQQSQVLAQRYQSRKAATADGVAIRVLLNVDDPKLLDTLNPAHCDGIGLTRTEFLFQDNLPDENSQYLVYRRIIEWAAGKPVTIRTLDAGGDKPIPGLTLAGERNPFLGVRGLRLMLARPDIFGVQLRALARAAAHSPPSQPLQVMLPMVTTPPELQQARALLQTEYDALCVAGIAAAMPAVGMMVEVPAAALTISDFEADFYSIGSNDLLQYLLAAARDSQALGHLYDPAHRALLELIQRVVAHGKRSDRAVSLCGELAAQSEHLTALLQAGLRCLSVPAAALGRIKAALATIELQPD